MPWPILIVEDDDAIRDRLSELLSARGYRTFTAANGNEALDLVRRRALRPSVVLLDLAMPEMDGYEFLESQANDPWIARVPVILVTAERPDREDRFPNVCGVLRKPVDVRALLALVKDACSGTPPA